jgi:hypothetical protein
MELAAPFVRQILMKFIKDLIRSGVLGKRPPPEGRGL